MSDMSDFHPPPTSDLLPQHPLHYHNPWDTTDPDNPHFTHREWRPTPNTRITRTTFQSNSPVVPNLLTMMGGESIYGQANTGASPFPPPGVGFPIGFPHHHHHHHVQRPWGTPHHPSTPDSDGPFHTRFGPAPMGAQNAGASINGMPFDLDNLFRTLFAQPQAGQQGGESGQRGPAPNLATMLSSFINPAALNGGQHGDAVYSEEAFDRLLSQFLEQNNGSSAPGPAPAAAIAALPKAKVEEKMMGNDGRAECSVCMENVEVGDEVTMLPCKHWFHGDCVGAWLKEHNTCPHCRQGIASTPATPSASGQPQQAMPGAYPFQRHRSAVPLSPIGQPGSSPSNPFSVPSSPGAPSPTSLHPSSSAGYPTRTTRTRSLGNSASITSGRNVNGGFHFSIQAGAPSSNRPSHSGSNSRRRDMSFSSSDSPHDERNHHSRTHSNSGASHRSRQSSRRGDANSNGSGSSGHNAGGGGITGWVRQRFGGS